MNIEIMDDERLDDLNCKNLKILQKKDGFCFGMDSVLIANFAKISRKNAIVADLGTGTGIISILVAGKQNPEKVYAVEIQEELVDMAKRSVKYNDLENKIDIINADIVGISRGNFNKKFDYVISNPPYKKLNTGLINDNQKKLISRHEVKCTLKDVVNEASKLLKDKGVFYMVHRPDRLCDIFNAMRENKVEPKEIQLVHSHLEDEANLVLIKGVKCGNPSLKVLKPLIVYNENNEYTEELLKFYDNEES
jgi:tRNA1Val (adenine37-N6)-methyltransferase